MWIAFHVIGKYIYLFHCECISQTIIYRPNDSDKQGPPISGGYDCMKWLLLLLLEAKLVYDGSEK